MEKLRSQVLTMVTASAASLVVLASSVAAEALRVRGEVIGVSGDIIRVENSAGQVSEVKAEELSVLVYRDIQMSDIPDDAYLSIASIPNGDGSMRALGISVFPEAMRGFNEGTGDWDLVSGSAMTNASLAQVVSRGGQSVMTVSYGDEEQVVHLAPTTPITTFDMDPQRQLGLGDLVILFADRSETGLSAAFAGVHENGSLPPL